MDNKKQITKSEFTQLRNDKCFTIDRLASYYSISPASVRRIMKEWNMPTGIKGRQRELPIELIDDTITRITEVNVTEPVNITEHEGA